MTTVNMTFERLIKEQIKKYLNVSEVPKILTREQLETIRDSILAEIESEVDDA